VNTGNFFAELKRRNVYKYHQGRSLRGSAD
jgi:hypothetical protein